MTADIFSPALAILSALSGAFAVFNWYRSSRVYLPDYDSVPVAEYEPGIHRWMSQSSRLNKRAALWTAVATALAAASAIVGVLT